MRTTITINDALYKVIKRQALEDDESVSSFIEDSVKRRLLEDAYDLENIDKILKEPRISHEQLVKELKAEGLL